jgi:hypothetical protein
LKHAGPETLRALAPLLDKIRAHATLVERTPGSFYLRSRGHLHFHEDPSGTYADIKLDGNVFTRVRATTAREQARLLALLAKSLRQPARKLS